MPELVPNKVESIKDVVAPQKFNEVEILLKLSQDATTKEREFYQRIFRIAPTRIGGGKFPMLNMCIGRNSYESLLDELKINSRLVHSVIFQSEPQGGSPWATPIEAYLLQGTEELVSYLI